MWSRSATRLASSVSSEGYVELVYGIALVILLIVFGGIGVAVGATAEGPDPGPPGCSPLKVRTTRAALLAIAAFMTVLGAEAALVAGWQQDPSTGRAEVLVFLLEGAVDLALAFFVLMPAWTLRRIWVLRLVSVCWLVVGAGVLVITFGSGPLATFYLGLGPDMWAAFSVVVGAALVWLSSLGLPGVAEPAAEPAAEPRSAPAPAAAEVGAAESAAQRPSTPAPALTPQPSRLPPTHWRGIVTGVALASLVAISSWPLAQFVGINAMGGCAPQWLVPGNPAFCVSGRLDGRMLTVSGQTTLPDGALVDIAVSSDDLAISEPPSAQRVSVNGGTFEATFDLSRRRSGSVTVTAALHMAGQPAAVAQSYGTDGHALAGPTALADGSDDGRSLLATLHFDLG